MGYQVGSVCYATTQEASNALFSSIAPSVVVLPNGSVQELDFIYNSTFNLWSLRLSQLDLNDHTSRVILHTSNPVQTSSAYPPCNFVDYSFDPVLAGALFMFALTMVLGCWLLAKNAGLIINMIKRW